jgi:hypothetical protein
MKGFLDATDAAPIRNPTNAVARRSREDSYMRKFSRLVGLAGISPAFAVVGGMIDERAHLGFTNWRSACRASGISLQSLTYFTLELLPTAVVGALLGGVLVLLGAFFSRHARGSADCLAAHAGCAIAMPLGLLLCAMAMPVPLMLAAEVALAGAAAALLRNGIQRHDGIGIASHP